MSASTVLRWASVSVSPLTPLRNAAAAAAAERHVEEDEDGE